MIKDVSSPGGRGAGSSPPLILLLVTNKPPDILINKTKWMEGGVCVYKLITFILSLN
jgi:hypothetical protein